MRLSDRSFCAVAVFCTLLTALSNAAAQSPPDILPLENFSDRFSKDVPISGRMLVGVAVIPPESSMPRGIPIPTVLWPEAKLNAHNDSLCLTFASRDGQYYGEGQIGADKLGKRTRPFQARVIPNPEAKKALDTHSADDIAVLATSGNCRIGASSEKGIVYVVQYGPDLDKPSHYGLSMLINSMAYTITAEIAGEGWKDQAVCNPLPEGQRNKAFNTLCKVTVPATGKQADLRITRRRYERVFPTVQYKLAWGSPR
jgi:hypothetical protein